MTVNRLNPGNVGPAHGTGNGFGGYAFIIRVGQQADGTLFAQRTVTTVKDNNFYLLHKQTIHLPSILTSGSCCFLSGIFSSVILKSLVSIIGPCMPCDPDKPNGAILAILDNGICRLLLCPLYPRPGGPTWVFHPPYPASLDLASACERLLLLQYNCEPYR